MKDFPFKTCFAELIIKPMVSAEKDQCLALASLVEVSKFIPNIDTSKNVDLLPVAFNACVINRVNKNTDVVDTTTALAMYKHFAFKPINVEHQRQKVIGMILTAGFSEFGTDRPLSEDQVKTMTGPFNITLGGVIWRTVAPELSNLIEESGDPTSQNYFSVSASWELGFTGYQIALLEAGRKNLAEATRIITDASEIETVQNKLISLGGDGKFEDLFAYRMPTTDVVPLGIGFTEKPAAEVKGIASQTKEKIGMDIPPAVGKPPLPTPDLGVTPPQPLEKNEVGINQNPSIGTENLLDKKGENQNNISQSHLSNVKTERIDTMKISSLQDISEASVKDVTPVAIASAVSEFISSELTKGSATWEKEKNALNDQIAQANTLATQAKTEFEKVQAQMQEVKATLEKLQAEKAEREQVELFNSRMAEVVASYDLDEEVRAALVEEIKAIASSEDWAKWQSKAKVLLKGYAKKAPPFKKDDDKKDDDKDDKAKAKKAKADDAGDDDAAAKAAVAAALDNADKPDAGLPNGGASNKKSLKETYASAFAFTKENFVINR